MATLNSALPALIERTFKVFRLEEQIRGQAQQTLTYTLFTKFLEGNDIPGVNLANAYLHTEREEQASRNGAILQWLGAGKVDEKGRFVPDETKVTTKMVQSLKAQMNRALVVVGWLAKCQSLFGSSDIAKLSDKGIMSVTGHVYYTPAEIEAGAEVDNWILLFGKHGGTYDALRSNAIKQLNYKPAKRVVDAAASPAAKVSLIELIQVAQQRVNALPEDRNISKETRADLELLMATITEVLNRKPTEKDDSEAKPQSDAQADDLAKAMAKNSKGKAAKAA